MIIGGMFSVNTITENKKRISAETIAIKALQLDGKQLFLLQCASCHHATRDLIGPSIYAVRSRWPNKNLLYQYIRNSSEVIKKDPYAKNLFIKWNKTVMTPFPKITNAEIELILNYVDSEAKRKGLM
jgi:mono/diheme cytochrome c family protein